MSVLMGANVANEVAKGEPLTPNPNPNPNPNQVVGGVLSLALFCGGHNYFASQFPQRLGWQPYSIHTTFQYGAADGKR